MADAIYIRTDGTGHAIDIDQNGSGVAIEIWGVDWIYDSLRKREW